MAKMYNPPHPGELVKEVLITNSNLSITAAAALLGVTRVSISKLVNCRCSLSAEMAMRLSIALNTSVEMWINMQASYDMWQIEKKRNTLRREVTRVTKALAPAHLKKGSKIKTTRVKNTKFINSKKSK